MAEQNGFSDKTLTDCILSPEAPEGHGPLKCSCKADNRDSGSKGKQRGLPGSGREWGPRGALARSPQGGRGPQGGGFQEDLELVGSPNRSVLEKNEIARPFPEMSERSGRCRRRFKSVDIDFFKLIKIQEK